MTTAATPLTAPAPVTAAVHDKINKGPHKIGIFVFGALLAIGVVYALSHLISDISHVHHPSSAAFLLLGVALLVALGFEFVNGFTIQPTPWRGHLHALA
jgi:PiT family inorganic phosphate transporter